MAIAIREFCRRLPAPAIVITAQEHVELAQAQNDIAQLRLTLQAATSASTSQHAPPDLVPHVSRAEAEVYRLEARMADRLSQQQRREENMRRMRDTKLAESPGARQRRLDGDASQTSAARQEASSFHRITRRTDAAGRFTLRRQSNAPVGDLRLGNSLDVAGGEMIGAGRQGADVVVGLATENGVRGRGAERYGRFDIGFREVFC